MRASVATSALNKAHVEGDMDSEYRFAAMDRRDFLRLGGAGLAGATLLGTAGGRVLARTASSLEAQFETAARKYRVPVELLLAMGYYNTLWEMPPPSASAYRKGDPEGRGDYGIMQLTQNPSRNTLGTAAKLTGFSRSRLKNDRFANIEGGAAVLSYLVGKTRPKRLDGWQEALTQYADTDLYAGHVYGVLKTGASAHYVVGRRGGVAQCVRDEDIAWHAGWWNTNKHSIGIEHAGYVNNPDWFTRRMYRASARLSARCCKKYRIPVDRKHIIGHYQVPGCSGSGGGTGCHTDPGHYWNWTKYMRLVRYYRNRL